MLKIKPRGKYILVERDEAESHVSKHGISAPSMTEREEKAFGTVVAVGDQIKDVKKGDRVVYGAFAGEEIEIEEGDKKKKYRLLEDEFVIAFIIAK